MKTILITNDPVLAAEATQAGVDRIMVDLESHGKKERQASRNTFISSHKLSDIAPVRKAIGPAELIVRINPWHADSKQEIDQAIKGGAQYIMLPMITDMQQLEHYIAAVNGRTGTLPLVETRYSMEHIGEIANHAGVSELYIGLNDLHLSLGMDFLFEPLAERQVDKMANVARKAGKSFGFGGIGALGGNAELSAEKVLAEHARLGSTRVILSSRFGKDIALDQPDGRKERLQTALAKLHDTYEILQKRSSEKQQQDFAETANIIRTLAASIKQKRAQA
jgi:citrate lyase beta subunit